MIANINLLKKISVFPDWISKKKNITIFRIFFLPNIPINIKIKRQFFQVYFNIKVLNVYPSMQYWLIMHTYVFSYSETIHQAILVNECAFWHSLS